MKASKQMEDRVARSIRATAKRVREEEYLGWEDMVAACDWLVSVAPMVVDLLDDDMAWSPRATVRCSTPEGIEDVTLARAAKVQFTGIRPYRGQPVLDNVWLMGCDAFAEAVARTLPECVRDWNSSCGIQIEGQDFDADLVTNPYDCLWMRRDFCVRFGSDSRICRDACAGCTEWRRRGDDGAE